MQFLQKIVAHATNAQGFTTPRLTHAWPATFRCFWSTTSVFLGICTAADVSCDVFFEKNVWFLGLLVPSSISQSLQVEVWWPLSLLALGLGALAVACRLVFLWIRSRRAKKVDRILGELYESLWDAWINVIMRDQWVGHIWHILENLPAAFPAEAAGGCSLNFQRNHEHDKKGTAVL